MAATCVGLPQLSPRSASAMAVSVGDANSVSGALWPVGPQQLVVSQQLPPLTAIAP